MDEFEWHTEVDSGWEPVAPEERRPKRRPSRRTRVILAALAICTLLALAAVVIGSLRGRVEEATTTAEMSLLLAHELLVGGALNGDRDRVLSVVAERPSSWHDLNADLLSRQLFFSRRPLGIEVMPEAAARSVPEEDVRLSPELNSAQIVDRRPYSVMNSQRVSETVLLERDFFYDRVGEQWQLSPARDERAYWGNWVTDERDNVTLTYPERDEAVAIRLSGYLDSFLPALCEAEGMACPDDFHLLFKLERDPASIRRLGDGVFAIRASSAAAGDRLVLPAPSLVGRPVDDAGYKALQRGYAGWIGASIVASYGVQVDSLDQVLALFDLQRPAAPSRPLPEPVAALFGAEAVRPNQDVLLLCRQDSVDRLLRFETNSGRWREEATSELWQQFDSLTSTSTAASWSILGRLPDYQGSIIQTPSDEGGQTLWRSYLWRDGAARLITEEEVVHYFLPPRLQTAGYPPSNILAYFAPESEDGALFSALIVNLDECTSLPCTTVTLPGMPVWSPGGQRTVLITPGNEESQTLYLGDMVGETVAEIGPGQSPAWLDDNRLVYVVADQPSELDPVERRTGQEVVLIEAGDETLIEGRLLFDAETIRQAIPERLRPDSLGIWTVQPAGGDNQWWYVTARGERDGERADYVLVYDPVAQMSILVAPMTEYELAQPPLVNKSGDQAVVVGLSADGSQVSVELIDTNNADIRRLASVVPQDWSADGDWLIQADNETLTLVSTTSEVEWPIQHEMPGCYWAVWTDREEQQGDS